jgi:hypothetical protein
VPSVATGAAPTLTAMVEWIAAGGGTGDAS